MPQRKHTCIIQVKNSFAREYLSLNIVKQGLHLIATPRTVSQTLYLIEQHKPDLIICEDDFECVEILLPKIKGSGIKTLMIADKSKAAEILEFFEQGILGILRIDSPTNELPIALKVILTNQIYVSSAYNNYFKKENLKIRNVFNELTIREIEILNLIAKGLTNIQIGSILNISPNSVNNHRANIRKKLNLKGGKSELLQLAIMEKQ